MDKKDRQGITFGFGLVIVWLLILTGLLTYDKINLDKGRLTQTIIMPPQLELLEVDLEPIVIKE